MRNWEFSDEILGRTLLLSHAVPYFLSVLLTSQISWNVCRNLILTLFAFGLKMLYLCDSEAGLSIGKPRFLRVFRDYRTRKQLCFYSEKHYLELKNQVFVLKIRYGLYKSHSL